MADKKHEECKHAHKHEEEDTKHIGEAQTEGDEDGGGDDDGGAPKGGPGKP